MSGNKGMGLLPRLALAIVLGILIGNYGTEFWVRLLLTLGGIFGNFLTFVIPLIIIGFVAPGIGELGQGAGKSLLITLVFAYVSTIMAGTGAYFVNAFVFPRIIDAASTMGNSQQNVLAPFFIIEMPPIMGVMSALLLAFILGIGMGAVNSKALASGLKEFQKIVEKLLGNVIIPLLPLLICSTFAKMAYSGQAQLLLRTFAKVYLTIIALHFGVNVVQYAIACFVARRNLFCAFLTMLPAYLTAIGTQSSAATIPVTLRQTKLNGVSEDVADFAIPLCATIHLPGSTVAMTSCAMALMVIHGLAIPAGTLIPFVFMLGIVMVAAPGVPGGAVMAALGILSSMLDFTPEMIPMMVGVYMAQDSFGTACNVMGDGALAVLIDKTLGHAKVP